MAADPAVVQHLMDSKERVIALTEQRGEVVLIEDQDEHGFTNRRLMIFDPRHRCIAMIKWGDFSALCNELHAITEATRG